MLKTLFKTIWSHLTLNKINAAINIGGLAIGIGCSLIIYKTIAYITMDNWLQKFAFKTELSWWLFALAGGVAMVIALITVSGQTFTAARRNPIEAFRYE
jgi:putative ABC transport system permease protein